MLPMRDEQQTTNEQLKIELLSQWKLEAESRKNEPFWTDDIFEVWKKDDLKKPKSPLGCSSSWNSCSLVGQQRCFDAGNLPVKIHLTDDVLAAT